MNSDAMSESPRTRRRAFIEVTPEWILQIATLASSHIPTHAKVLRAAVDPLSGNVLIVIEHSLLPLCHEGELMERIVPLMRTQ